MKQKIKSVAESNPQSPALRNNRNLSKRITTKKGWKDLNIERTAKLQLNSINDLIPKLRTPYKIGEERTADEKAGYKVLFAGSGKGKKLAAKLLGKQNSLDVYKIDVPGVVSRYIGETEKNLEKIFGAAKENNSILFFDEADALFGKRTGVKDAHDRYANLLQRIKEYPGLVIFSSKNKDDSADTFPIHPDAIVHFKKPS